ncbi:hypothetical protein [Flagellimonas sp.]|uniref:hypothetical protein n=1 Tax=Flagellimonas sp. TaxID=2058762 RepID=UPI003BB05C09
MAGLAKTYSKEIIKELDMIPVYLPGTKIEPGDIITFSHTNALGRPQPIGSFRKETNLIHTLGLDLPVATDDGLGAVRFSSRNGVSMEFKAAANAGNVGKGELNVSFTKEGSTYLAATGLSESRIEDMDKLRTNLNKIRNKYTGDWNKSFIVVSVRTAKKALVMQSNSSQGSLTISGETQTLQAGAAGDIKANLKFAVSSFKDAAFIKDWNDDVELFVGLARYRKRFLGSWKLGHGFAATRNADWEMATVYPDELDFGTSDS